MLTWEEARLGCSAESGVPVLDGVFAASGVPVLDGVFASLPSEPLSNASGSSVGLFATCCSRSRSRLALNASVIPSLFKNAVNADDGPCTPPSVLLPRCLRAILL